MGNDESSFGLSDIDTSKQTPILPKKAAAPKPEPKKVAQKKAPVKKVPEPEQEEEEAEEEEKPQE